MQTSRADDTRSPDVGDVVACRRVGGDVGDLDGIEVQLHGHGHRYVVAVELTPAGPKLVDLRITGPHIDYGVLRAIPARRLAYAAAEYAARSDGRFALPLDTDDTDRRPEAPTSRGRLDDTHYRDVAERVRAAVAIGAPVRQTVAAAMHTTVPTLDRWIRTAKNLGYLGEHDIPRRKRPTGGTQR
ncbi:hypothetical protein [Rhodococcus aetherivorans]|uniref:hypothetical protein n=1 Tax=Rhodococcus aetherivorans TaxID=191292 RepID=UPI001E61C87F|nr:hypothetical protein [Rhodococcus aetherivorans]UGQ43395.1 hypothetical protein LRQ66_08990 [Rhodococcus aetherivorans]